MSSSGFDFRKPRRAVDVNPRILRVGLIPAGLNRIDSPDPALSPEIVTAQKNDIKI